MTSDTDLAESPGLGRRVGCAWRFQTVLSGTRESLARHYLRDGSLSATEIALLLGYDEPSSFYRAYHAWTGQTPAQARDAAR